MVNRTNGRPSTFGRRLRSIRQATGLPVQAVAILTDLTRQYIHDLERGRREPSEDTLEALAKALYVSQAALRGETSCEPNPTMGLRWKIVRKEALIADYEKEGKKMKGESEPERVVRKWFMGMARKFRAELVQLEEELRKKSE